MFTVKVCRPNGHEDLYEAREVTKEHGGLLIQIGTTDTIYLGPGGQMIAWEALTKHRANHLPGSEPPMESEMATFYVMNRFGSTIATYYI